MEDSEMNYADLLLKRRSIRNYQEKAVANEIIMEIIKESTYAPSAGNGQPWKFIVINDRALMQEISDEAKKNILDRIAANPNDYVKKYQKMLMNDQYNIFYNAPAVVYIIGEKKLKNMPVDCALAASYFMMSAVARGLGTCWINFARHISSPELLNKIGFPKNHEMIAPIIIGYPAQIPTMAKRKEPEIIKIL